MVRPESGGRNFSAARIKRQCAPADIVSGPMEDRPPKAEWKNHRPLLLQRPVVLCTFFGKILFAQEAESGQQIGAAPQRPGVRPAHLREKEPAADGKTGPEEEHTRSGGA